MSARQTARRKSDRRWVAASLAVALHLAIVALFLRRDPATAIGSGEGQGAISVSLGGLSQGASPLDKPTPPATADPPEKPAQATPPDPIKPRSVLAIVSDILAIPLPEHSVTPTPLVVPPSPAIARAMAQASGAAGAACDIGGAIQTALRSDPAAHGAILLIPAATRTAADAVLLWNGQWIEPIGGQEASALGLVRGVIGAIVATAPAECQNGEIVGPRFMLIPDGDVATVVVVFGKATWRWSELSSDTSRSIPDGTLPNAAR